MRLARVIGSVVATRKNRSLDGAKLLLAQPIDADGRSVGGTQLAVDAVGAGVGETVLLVLEGRAAGSALGRRGAPVDAALIGIVDAGEPIR
ncbi:MAG: ethanolamine utilization protein EutN [Acidobacteria bacterium]|jgi:ethanolamine utilization protein EutN|nr:ethanolamine utilization protein EutN [Acidobacteriota bacterium]